MKQITLNLSPIDTRPIVQLDSVLKFPAMLDTGARFPVWNYDEEILQAIGGEKIRENVSFGGFGGMTQGTLYRIKSLRVGELIFPHLPVVAAKLDVPCYMLLSATMFDRLIYEIDKFHHKLNITIPDTESSVRNIKDYDDNGRIKIVLAND